MRDIRPGTVDDIGKLLLRITVAGLLLFHGIAKLQHGIGFITGDLERLHIPSFLGYGVYIGEVAAPLLLLAGIWTRIAGLIVAFNLVVAVLMARLPAFFTVGRSGGWSLELEAFFLLGGLAIALLGPGKLRIPVGRRT
jgi:putative oxidoreductase